MADDPKTPRPRAPARDTREGLRDVASELDGFREVVRLEFVNIRATLSDVQAKAHEAHDKATPKPISWAATVPIVLTLIGLIVTVSVAMDRKIDRAELKEELRQRDQRIEQLERESKETKTSAEQLREVISAVRGALLQRDEERKRR